MFIATDYTSNEIRAIFIKNGTLKLNEYTIMRQNLTDGTDIMIYVFYDFYSLYAD